jgi:hypothetical protein
VAELENVASEVRDLKGDLSKANARVQDLEEFIRPFAEGAHDIDCDCDHLACTCIVGPAQELLGKGRDRAADRMGTDS